ncbi:MAG: hypothetical protein ACK53V_11650, partial [Planctomycetota bacterium]
KLSWRKTTRCERMRVRAIERLTEVLPSREQTAVTNSKVPDVFPDVFPGVFPGMAIGQLATLARRRISLTDRFARQNAQQ